MEHRLVRQEIKKCDAIYCHPNYFLFSGKNFQSLFRQGGSLVTYPEVKLYLHGLAALPNNRLLVDDAKSMLHLLDLNDGKVLASQKLTKKRICPSRFAITPDGNTAFRLWCWDKNWYLININLSDLTYNIIDYPASLRFVGDVIVNSLNELLVLESQVDDDGTCRNQVSTVLIKGEQCTATPVYKWHGDRTARCFDGRYVWESQYWIRDLKTGDCFNLLENSNIFLPEKHVPLWHTFDSQNKCLQIVDRNQTIFIDCEQRKIIARYRRDTREPAFIGTRVGDEFWFGKHDGIYASPFPLVEDI